MTAISRTARSALDRASARRTDVAIGGLLCAATFALHLVDSLAVLPSGDDLPLFETDTARVARHMAVRGPMLDRGQFHPLFALLTQTPVRVLVGLGFDRGPAIRIVIAAYGALAVAAMYVLARRRLPAASAAAPAALFAVSAASTVFYAIPETFGVGAAAVAWTLVIVDRWTTSPPPRKAALALVLAPAAVVSGAVVAAIAVVARLRGVSAWARTAGLAALTAVILLLAQRLTAGTELNLTLGGESDFVSHDVGASIIRSLRTAIVDVWALPTPVGRSGHVTVRDAGWFDSWARTPLTIACIVVAVATAVACWSRRRDLLVIVAAIGLAAHVVLHSWYGNEPFLYAAMALPLVVALVVVALAVVASGPYRRGATVACWVFASVLLAVNQRHLHDIGGLLDAAR